MPDRPSQPDRLTCQRHQFSIPPAVHYFDCAFVAPLMRCVEAAAAGALARGRVPSALGPRDFFDEADRARLLFAQLINCRQPQRIAIVPSVSYGLATVARNLHPERGQNLVVAQGQFPSNLLVWRRVAAESDCVIRAVPPPDSLNGRGERWTTRLLDAIDGNTAVVALGTVDWSDGTRFDLEMIGERARAVGAAFVLDGIQSVRALPFDLDRIQPDALVVGAYKWLLGPMGIGLAYLGPRFDDGDPLEETWLGRLGSEDFSQLDQCLGDYQSGAIRYDMGGRAQFVLLPMLIAALQRLLLWTPGAIQDYCARVGAPLVSEGLALGYEVAGNAERCAHLFALRPAQGLDPAKLRDGLAARNIFVSVRRGMLRVSLNVFNDEQDVACLVEALHDLTDSRPRRGL